MEWITGGFPSSMTKRTSILDMDLGLWMNTNAVKRTFGGKQMVKLLRTWAAMLVLFSMATPAFAGPRLETRVIPGREYTTATGGTNFVLLSGTAGFVDSTYFSLNVTGASTAAQQETTAAFTLPDLAMVPTQPGNTVTAVDTLYGFEATLAPVAVSGVTAALDTATFTLQGSFDGSNWSSAPAVRVLKSTGGTTAQKMYNVIWSLPHAAGTAVENKMLHYPLLRMIIGGGGTYGGTDSGAFQFWVRYWRDVTSPNPGLK